MGVTIKNGYFSVEHYGGSVTKSMKLPVLVAGVFMCPLYYLFNSVNFGLFVQLV